MSTEKQTLVFVVFCHETKELTFQTTLECEKALNSAHPDLQLIFIFVDDGSSDVTTRIEIEKSCEKLIRHPNVIIAECIFHESRLGLASSLQSVVNFLLCKGVVENVWMTQIPGNDQLDRDSINCFLDYPYKQELRILWRGNTRTRPLLKRVASFFLQKIVNLFLFPDINQVTSNFIAPLNFYQRWLVPASGHAYGLWLIAGSVHESLPIKQLEFNLKIRKSRNHVAVRRTPKFQDIILMLLNIIKVKIFIYKNR